MDASYYFTKKLGQTMILYVSDGCFAFHNISKVDVNVNTLVISARPAEPYVLTIRHDKPQSIHEHYRGTNCTSATEYHAVLVEEEVNMLRGYGNIIHYLEGNNFNRNELLAFSKQLNLKYINAVMDNYSVKIQDIIFIEDIGEKRSKIR
eukprot:UN02158